MRMPSLIVAAAVLVSSAAFGEYTRPDGPTLRELAAARGKRLGTNFSFLVCDPPKTHKPGDNPHGAAADWQTKRADELNLIRDQFDLASAGWQMFPGHSWIAPREYCLDGAKAFIEWGKANKVDVMFHGLGYIQRGFPNPKDAAPLYDTPEKRQAFREDYAHYLTTFLQTYRGTVYAYDILNEHLAYGQYNRTYAEFNQFPYLSAWGASKSEPVYGIEYYVETFTTARKVDPNAKLIYLDYCNEIICPKANTHYRVTKELLQRGLKFDGVGFQLHQNANFNRSVDQDPANVGPAVKKNTQLHDLTPSQFIDSMRENVQRFADLGLEVWYTELDVKTDPKEDRAARQERQALVYRKLMEVCLEFDNIKVYKLWGTKDTTGTNNVQNDLYLFDQQGAAKPAFFAVRDALQHYRPAAIASDDFDAAPAAGSRWLSTWSFDNAQPAAPAFAGQNALRIAGSASRSANLTGTYAAHLAYRWRWAAEPAATDRVLLEARTPGQDWKPLKTHDAKELAARKLEGDWHAGFATLDGFDGVANCELRLRVEGATPFHVDSLRLIASPEWNHR